MSPAWIAQRVCDVILPARFVIINGTIDKLMFITGKSFAILIVTLCTCSPLTAESTAYDFSVSTYNVFLRCTSQPCHNIE